MRVYIGARRHLDIVVRFRIDSCLSLGMSVKQIARHINRSLSLVYKELNRGMVIDLSNREIIGYSCGANKEASLVKKVFASIKGDLRKVEIFHTDRGSEFDNYLIDETLEAFGIKRSLSAVACPYDNAVAESTFKIIKT